MLNQFILHQHTDKLRQLVAIGATGNITAAARQVGLTQSALSHSIRSLEDHLGQSLLVRKPRGVEFTQAGKTLYTFAKQFMSDLEDTELRLRNPSGESGRLRIATHETLAIHIFPRLVNHYFSEHPNLVPSVTSGRVDPLIQGVLNSDYDIALTVEPFRHEKLSIELIYEGRIDFFVGTKVLERYRHIDKSQITIEEASSVPILTDVDAHMRQGVPLPQALASLGFSLRNLFELNSFEASMRLAAEGAGIAVVADRNAQSLIESGHLRRIRIKGVKKSDFGTYRICATTLKTHSKRPVLKHLVELLTNELK